jgi:hypothetical protein
VSHPDGFHGKHCWASWPLLQRRQGLEVRHHPDVSAHAPSVGGVERIKDIVRIAPRKIVLDMLMKVLGNSGVCRVLMTGCLPSLRRMGSGPETLSAGLRYTTHHSRYASWPGHPATRSYCGSFTGCTARRERLAPA